MRRICARGGPERSLEQSDGVLEGFVEEFSGSGCDALPEGQGSTCAGKGGMGRRG